MQTTIFGKTGLKVSRVAFGTWQMGGDWGAFDEAAAYRAIERSREHGVNFFDTAQAYGWGASEELLGRILRDDLDHHRDEVVIATKGGVNLRDGKLRRDSSPEWLRRGVEQSLEALGVDYIDLYQVHWPDADTPFAETAEALHDLVDQGVIRHIGVSNFDVEQIDRFSNARPVESLQPPLSLFRRGIEDEILPYCLQENIGVFVYGPLAHGLLSGAMTPATTFGDGDWRTGYAEFRGEIFEQNLRVVEKLAAFATNDLGCSLGQLALAWALSRAGVHAVIIGTLNADHVDAAVAATEMTLSAADLEAIETIMAEAATLEGVTPESF